MKWISFLLLTLLLFLTAIPCDDAIAEEASISSENIVTIPDQDHPDHSHQEDTCTPFCTCNCCQTHSSFPLVLVKSEYNLKIKKHKPVIYNKLLSARIVDSIWRPPQFA